jgi:hemerythrin-like domain-containing protein
MLRNQNLIPLSHQHQHALALCVRIERASPIADTDLEIWRKEIALQFRNEIAIHFAAEERVIFPAARRFPELASVVNELQAEHSALRKNFAAAEAGRLPAEQLVAFARELSAHIRKEERQLFERLQALVSAEELNALGREVNVALASATHACIIPSEATKLQPRKKSADR